MSDLTITAANVLAGSSATVKHGEVAGATITAGEALYKDPADNLWKLADCDSATAAAKTCDGIALNGASANQPLSVLTGGPVTIGATVVPGTVYCLSATAGAIAPQADITTGDDVVVIGVATSASVINVRLFKSGVTL